MRGYPVVVLFGLLGVSAGCGRTLETGGGSPELSAPERTAENARPNAVATKTIASSPFVRFAGEWTDQWHSVTIEPDGLGFCSSDFGSWYGSAEFQVREEGGQASAEMPHPGSRGSRPSRLFDLRLKEADTLELLERGGQATYILKKQRPKAPARVGDFAGSWRAWEVVSSEPDAPLVLRELTLSLNGDGKGTGRLGGGPPTGFALQPSEQRFTLAGPGEKTWEFGLIPLAGNGANLRLKSADGTVRIYMAKAVAGKKKDE
jgi:hypothetical protein